MKMKLLGLLLAAMLGAASVKAQVATTTVSLDAVMKEMGPAFKTLAGNIANPDLNPASLEVAQKLGDNIYVALSLLPKMVETAPDEEKPAKILQFRDVMGRLYVACVAVQHALLTNDNAKAKIALKTMNDIKSEGHSLFIPPQPH